MMIISSVKYLRSLGMLVAALASGAVGAEQMHYTSPEEATQALIDAAVAEDSDALKLVLGPQTDDLSSGDPVADAADYEAFVDAAVTAAGIEQEEGVDDKATLVVGEDDWPFPIPLVKEDKGWRFDTEAGLEEIYTRRIGRNELYAIAVTQALADAQQEYASEDRDGDGVKEYAQRIGSSEGQRDGLFWPAADGEPESPIGPLVAEAVEEGYFSKENKDAGPAPYHGYYYRILTSQGASASGGAMSYVQDGNMSKGFAVIAYPAEYGNSGIMTFMINQQGIVFEKDLGDSTEELASAVTAYDPDNSWDLVTD